jgi:xylulokinase
LLDKDRNVLRPAIHFNDLRSDVEIERIRQKWGDVVLQRTCNAVSLYWTYPQLDWVRHHEPDVWSKLHSLIFPKDYVRLRLTGETTGKTDHIDAVGSLLYDPNARQWVDEFLNDIDFPAEALPEIRDSFAMESKVSAQGALDTGLHRGTPVLIGTTDTAAEMLAAGAFFPGQGTIKLASVGRIAFIAPNAVPHQHVLSYPYLLNDLWYPGTAMKYAASAYRWLRESLWYDIPDNAYQAMDAAAESTPEGAYGLIFLPHLMGQSAPLWDGKLSGAFLGVTLDHQLGHFTRAVLEGVAFGIKDAFTAVNELGLDASEIFLIGDGARSPLWRQIIANVMNRPITLPAEPDAAYGAALMAGIAVGNFAGTPEGLRSLVAAEAQCEPQSASVEIYDDLFHIYRLANQATQSISYNLYDFRKNNHS